MNPLVSVVIPTYNRKESLRNAVDSVLNQTMKDFEIIIVDDCSTDGTDSLNYMPHNEITFLRLGKNSGTPVIPRNVGVQAAVGKYVAFLDSDDIWTPEKLEVQIDWMELAEANFAYHDMIILKDMNYEGVERELWSKRSTPFWGYNAFHHLVKKNYIATSSVVVKRDIYLAYGKMDKDFRVSHDWDLWLKIAQFEEIHYNDCVLGYLKLHDGSVITESHRRRKESRAIVRKWIPAVGKSFGYKVLAYYYVMEVFDLFPIWFQNAIRKMWYARSKYDR